MKKRRKNKEKCIFIAMECHEKETQNNDREYVDTFILFSADEPVQLKAKSGLEFFSMIFVAYVRFIP